MKDNEIQQEKKREIERQERIMDKNLIEDVIRREKA